MFGAPKKRTPPAIVVVYPNSGLLHRYLGRHLTHRARIEGGVNGSHAVDIMVFRRSPDLQTQYLPEPA